MARIIMCQAGSDYHAEVDTGVLQTIVENEFLGMQFISPDGERISIVMRDGGFEIAYLEGNQFISLKNGDVTVYDNIFAETPLEN